MFYQCSECKAHMGAMLDKVGQPELFKCHKTGRVAHTLPEFPERRKPIKPRKDFLGEDVSHLAKRRDRSEVR